MSVVACDLAGRSRNGALWQNGDLPFIPKL
jgi:hypothetical protein